jgi:RNA polymerase sigma-70 factor (ECF subfamily)
LTTPLARKLTAELVVAEPAACVHPPSAAADRDFNRIFREFAPYLARVLPRMGVRSADVDDVMQDVFVAIHRSLPGFEGRSSLKSWVYGICIRVCSNYRQRAHHRRERLSEAMPEPARDGDQERTLEARVALGRLDAALSALPALQRATFVLYEIEELSIREIAAALGCSKFTLYARLYAARRVVQLALRGKREEEDHA